MSNKYIVIVKKKMNKLLQDEENLSIIDVDDNYDKTSRKTKVINLTEQLTSSMQ